MQRTCSPSLYGLAAALAGGLLLGLLLAGCGEDGRYDPTPTATLPLPTPTAEGGGALPLERFHYVASLTLREEKAGGEAGEVGISTEGDFQSPDRHAFTYTVRLGGGTVSRSAVIIGEKAWFRRGDESWQQTTRDDPEVADLLAGAFPAVRPDFLGGPQFQRVQESVRRLPSTEEAVNGVPADHYKVDPSGREFFKTFLALEPILPHIRDLAWDLWLAQDGAWPVRLLASTTIINDFGLLEGLELEAPVYWEMRIDISRPNDPALVVVAPDQGD